MPEPWVSVDEVASHLGVAKDSIYRWIESKALPAHRVGRLWKFKVTEIDKWFRAGEREVRKVLRRSPGGLGGPLAGTPAGGEGPGRVAIFSGFRVFSTCQTLTA